MPEKYRPTAIEFAILYGMLIAGVILIHSNKP